MPHIKQCFLSALALCLLGELLKALKASVDLLLNLNAQTL
jgi:hypothetical protein